MKVRTLLESARNHLSSNDIVGLLLGAALLGPLFLLGFGYRGQLPLGLSAPNLALVLTLSFGIIYLTGVRARNDMTVARLRWEVGLVVPTSLLFGWLMDNRADSFFTPESFYQVCSILLLLSIVSGLLERRAARGTPSDVLAIATSSTAAIGLVLFWTMLALSAQEAAAALLLLTGLLVVLTMLLRLPGAIVPIYKARRRWSRKGRGAAK